MKYIAVFFGGVSVEHDVSVITGVLTLNTLDKEKFVPVPIYVDGGNWYTGEELFDVENYKTLNLSKLLKVSFLPGSPLLYKVVKGKKLAPLFPVSAAINCLHGERGEDGSLAGLLKMCEVPLASPDALCSSVCMDKGATKIILKGLKIKTLPYAYTDKIADCEEFAAKKGFPVIVKPAKLGSSIGISRANNDSCLSVAFYDAIRYGEKVIIEKCLEDFTEINCAAYKNAKGEIVVSECEEPVGKGKILSFDDKYSSGGRKFPALIAPETSQKIKETTKKIYSALSFSGIIRIDYFIVDKEIFVNEINSVPGSLAYYLFCETLKEFSAILSGQIEIAERAYARESTFIKKFSSSILQIKGAKGSKHL